MVPKVRTKGLGERLYPDNPKAARVTQNVLDSPHLLPNQSDLKRALDVSPGETIRFLRTSLYDVDSCEIWYNLHSSDVVRAFAFCSASAFLRCKNKSNRAEVQDPCLLCGEREGESEEQQLSMKSVSHAAFLTCKASGSADGGIFKILSITKQEIQEMHERQEQHERQQLQELQLRQMFTVGMALHATCMACA